MKTVFVKYGKEEHLQQIVDGKRRFSPSQNYVKMEELLHNKGQGDLLEGKMPLQIEAAQVYDTDTNELVGIMPKRRILISIQDVNNMPVFCLSSYSISEDNMLSLEHEHLDSIKSDFPDATHALIIQSSDTFIEDVKSIIGHKIVSDHIRYYDYSINTMQMYMYLTTGDEKIVHNSSMTYDNRYRHLLCKDISFSNQKEYRFIITDKLIEKPAFYDFHFNSPYKILQIDELYRNIILE